MGSCQTKAVESTVVERQSSAGFRVGVAEMNGWRNNMEDAHVIHIQPNWGFFGVYDGHGGEACSKFVAKRMYELLAQNGCPEDDAAVKKLMLGIDDEFLQLGQPSGSTGTMCIIHPPQAPGGKYTLRVVNIGDSRVILGRRDGSIVDGGGTDQGLTIDHKPDHPSERERIYRCGGTVSEAAGGVARVNGDLAVSRAFGDAEYKRTGGPGPEDHPVTADPELHRFECDQADFIMLVCDGVSEGDFPNPDVVRLAAAVLNETNDPGQASRVICHKAVEMNSKDNITCMIVMLDGTLEQPRSCEFNPGPLAAENKAFIEAYAAMAEKANLTLGQAIEKRYEELQTEFDAATPAGRALMQPELDRIGRPAGSKGSAERVAWFARWADEKQRGDQDDGSDGASGPVGGDMAMLRMLMGMMQGNVPPDQGGMP